jgi:uncharacterized protein YjdB/regulation of enolase protein 1 (concanavalin A-like superfamily)
MRKFFNIFWLVSCTLFLNAQQLTYVSRALGNSHFKCAGPHMQNHIVAMNVSGDGTCTTYSVWDEGFHPKGVYKDGKYIGNATFNANSKSVKDKSNKTWTIQNYYGRFLNSPVNSFPDFKIDPVPTGDKAPYIQCSDGRRITGIVDPVAVGINLKTGELLVADNSIDQNIKVFDISVAGAPVQVGTFGKQGGVFGDPIPGRCTDMLRFRGVTGVGGDNDGNIYVSMDGFPGAEGSGGGAEIRAFNPDGTLRWKMVGHLFLAAGCVDQASLDGTDIYGSYHRFKMDYNKDQGSDWTHEALTINPFLYPNDPRLVVSVEDAFAVKNINGKKYGFFTDMYNNMMWVYRFEGEIAVPCAGFCVAWGWNGDEVKFNSWNYTRGRLVVNGNDRRWLWIDKNGDGSGMNQTDEYSFYNFSELRVKGIDVDDEGNIYIGSASNGNVYKFPTNGFDSKGNPRYSTTSMEIFANVGHGAYSMKWVQENDMYFVANDNENMTQVDIWQNWSSSSRSKVRTVTIKPSLAGGQARQLTADKDYFYIVYIMDGGPGSNGKPGEIGVYKISDGSYIGYLIPGPEIGSCSSWIDMNSAVKVHVTSTGKRIITSEDNLVGKIIVYEWCPTGDCSEPVCSSSVDSVVISPSQLSMVGNDTVALSAHVYPDTVCLSNVNWSSSNTSVATVDFGGQLISKGVGTTTITATSAMQPTKSGSVVIDVSNLPVTGFMIIQDSISIPIGNQFQLTAAFQPVNALTKEIIWESNADAVAKVDNTGKVTAIGTGIAFITGKTVDANKIDTCVVTVYPIPASTIKISPSIISLWVNDTIVLKTRILPENASDKTPNWISLDPAVATISSGGDLKGISLGQAKIVASTSDGSLRDTCLVNVVSTNQFVYRDIGNPCTPGSTVVYNDGYEVTASGDDIYNNQDQFHMVYKRCKGDGQIVAKIVNYFNSEDWAKIGVMMRETIEPGSRHASMGILPGEGGSSLWYKPTTNGLASQLTLFDNVEAPYWVRLVRAGNRFTGSVSPDGKTWKSVGAVNIPMDQTLYVGLCVSSTGRCATTTVIFDSISTTMEVYSSVDDISLSDRDIELSPNPLSTGSLSIKLPDNATVLSISDITGKIVYQEKVTRRELLIDRSVFNAVGIYIVNVKTTDYLINKKIIVIQ